MATTTPTTLPPRMTKLGRIKAAIVEWLGVPITPVDGAFWAEFYGGESYSGEHVTPDRSLQNETVWACVGLLSETAATLPLGVYTRTPHKALAPKHPNYQILHVQPSANMATGTFIEILMVSLLLWGNAFAQILRGAGGRVTALEFILPWQVSMRRLSDGSIKYTWIGLDGGQRSGAEEDMLHVVGRTLNGITGVSPMTYARHMIGSTISADKAAAKMFKQGLLIAGTFETDMPIPEPKREAFQDRLKAYQGAIAAGKAPLLEAGIKYKGININPNDAQMLQTRQFSVEQICRWFRVPPHMVGHTTNSTSWGTGLEQQKNGFLTFTLMRWLKRMQDEFNRKLFTQIDRQTFFAEFNFEGLLQADSAARAAFYTAMTRSGIYTRDDCRERENLPLMGGNAEVLTVEANLIPLDKLGESQVRRATDFAPPTPPPAPASALNIHVGMPEQIAPQVVMHQPIHVRTPDVRVTSPNINVQQPAIHVAAAQAPNVDVHMSEVKVDSPVTVHLPEQPAPRVTINQPAPPAPAPVAERAQFDGVEFTFNEQGDVTGARLKP